MKKLWRYLEPYKKQLVIGPLFKLIEAVLELLVPTIMAKYLIDVGVANSDKAYIFKVGGVMIALAVVGLCCALVCQYNASVASQGFGTNLRGAVFGHIGTLSFREIDKFGASTLLNRITNDINTLQQAVAMTIRLVIRAPFICIGSFIMAMFINWKLGLIILATVPAFALIIWLIMHFTIPLYRKIQKKLDAISNRAIENFDGVRVIRAFAKQKSENRKYDESVEEFGKLSVFVGRISAVLNPATVFVLNVLILAVLWAGGVQVNIGGMTQGDIIAFTTYISYIMTAMLVVANLIILFTKAAVSKERVNELLDTQTSLRDDNGLSDVPESDTALEFKDVSFSYNEGEEVLENISFSLKRGETLGVIGGIGSGKTTLVSLIPRFYDAGSGTVEVFGRDVKNYKFKTLRKLVSIAMQKPIIFSGTVLSNIRQGKPDASAEEIGRAAAISQADEFISRLDKKYESEVEPEGKNFSGGQKQRIAIARALVGRPRILILDDSSSALDFATDLKFRKALREEQAAESIIIISQRVSAIKDCSKIIVLDDGKIVGTGTHTQLLKDCGEYAQIYTSQTKREAV